MRSTILLVLLLAGLANTGHASESNETERLQRGRYLATIGGCHDCHTPGYAISAGKVPESQWLVGDRLGYNGPWGTTYPTNLRQRIGGMDLPTWTAFARNVVARPPMPYWVLNTMSDEDLAALWTLARSLGPAGDAAPAALPPGVEPNGPAVRFPAPPTGH